MHMHSLKCSSHMNSTGPLCVRRNCSVGCVCGPSSPCRISDFSHLIGAARPKAAYNDATADPYTKTWRSGMFKNMKAVLKNSKVWFPVIENYVYSTRCCTQPIFATMWRALLDALALAGEHAAVEKIKEYYTEEQDDGQLCASWCTGVDRCVPGTLGASQAQESWHMQRARPGLGNKSQDFGSMMASLEKFILSRCKAIEDSPEDMYIVPSTSWMPDLIRGLDPDVSRLCFRTYSARCRCISFDCLHCLVIQLEFVVHRNQYYHTRRWRKFQK